MFDPNFIQNDFLYEYGGSTLARGRHLSELQQAQINLSSDTPCKKKLNPKANTLEAAISVNLVQRCSGNSS